MKIHFVRYGGNGRILLHLKNNIEDPRNSILIVSWQAPDTLGRRLAVRAPLVRIFGEVYERKAEVATIVGFSAHAGQDFLLEYALKVKDTAEEIFLVHGEAKQAETLMGLMRQKVLKDVRYPEWGETTVV